MSSRKDKRFISIKKVREDDKLIIKIKIDKKVSTKEYMEFLELLYSVDGISEAVRLLEINGQKNVIEDVKKHLLDKFTKDVESILSVSPIEVINNNINDSKNPNKETKVEVSQKNDEDEIIRPSQGI